MRWSNGYTASKLLSIEEDTTANDRIITQNVTLPKLSGAFSIALIARNSEMPMALSLKNMEIDVITPFNKLVINNLFHVDDLIKYTTGDNAQFKVLTPRGSSQYRWMAKKYNTNVPLGVGGGSFLKNDNSWKESGAFDPDNVQGDMLVTENCTLTIDYSARVFNEKSSNNNLTMFLAKKGSGGQFSELENSTITSTIKANQKTPLTINKSAFTFEAKKGDVFRFFMRSNIDDGFYLQSDNGGKPLFDVKVIAKVNNFISKNNYPEEIEITENGIVQDVNNYIISIDADSAVLSVKKK